MIVLRFSDYELDTIAEHEQILARSHVWWGWWKKEHENYPEALLSSLGARLETGPAHIGLVDRANGRYFSVRCSGLVAAAGEEMVSPEPDRTPAYYRQTPFPAWFRFDSIDRLQEADWVARFGTVPTGDPTIFEADRTQPEVESEILEASPSGERSGLLHLSDLHFGPDHGFGPSTTVTVRRTLIDKIVAGLPARPACVVVTGDLTTRGDAEGLTSARLFIEALGDRLELDRNAIALVPGNHDILIDDPAATRDFHHEQLYRDQLRIFYGRPVANERVHDVRDWRGRHYIIGTLNSSRPRHRDTMDYGYVGSDRSAPVFRTIEQWTRRAREDVWSAVALHHHVVPAPLVEEPEPGRPVSLTLDAADLVSLAHRHGVQALLHGHQHLPFVGEAARFAEFTSAGATTRGTRQAVTVLGGGSAGVARARIPDECGLNTFGYYQPFHDGGFVVECFGFNPGRDVHPLWSFVL